MGNPNWVKGVSGNPNGREKLDEPIRQAMMLHVPDAVAAIVGLMNSKKSEMRFKASQYIIDRVYGKPATAVSVGIDPNLLPMYRVIAPKEIPFDEWQKQLQPPERK